MAKPTTSIAIVLVAFFVASVAQAGARQDAVQAADARFRKAMTQGDASELEQIVADDAKIIHGNRGGIQDKAGLIREFRSYGIERYERTPVYSTENGNMAVLVSVTHKFFSGGRQVDTTTTEVLVRRSGRWQILILQNTDHAAA
ncbi:MAG: nuclear transport factor 2 family protein [Janthinobacterium lividum]